VIVVAVMPGADALLAPLDPDEDDDDDDDDDDDEPPVDEDAVEDLLLELQADASIASTAAAATIRLARRWSVVMRIPPWTGY